MHDFAAPFSILLLDVDKLKDLNAAFLNTGADEILHGIFGIFRNALPADLGYRLGGDEAGSLLPGVGLEEATRLAEEVRRGVLATFAEKQMPDGKTPTVSIGAGTSTARISGLAFEQAVERLRAKAKEARNAVVADHVTA
jgi:diguanylate cyclase (GGDEF)-like protein